MSEKAKEDTTLASCLVLLLGLPCAILLDAFVLSKGWHWFVVPTFDARPIPFAVFVGLRQLWIVGTYRSKKDDRQATEVLTAGLAIDVIALLVMWLARTLGAA